MSWQLQQLLTQNYKDQNLHSQWNLTKSGPSCPALASPWIIRHGMTGLLVAGVTMAAASLEFSKFDIYKNIFYSKMVSFATQSNRKAKKENLIRLSKNSKESLLYDKNLKGYYFDGFMSTNGF